jgi:hypothetical protein
VDIDIGTPNVTYAWGTVDPVNFINYNSARSGLQPVPLITALKTIPDDISTSLEYHYYMTPSVTLPSNTNNYYYCSAHTAPTNTSTRALQIVQVNRIYKINLLLF